MGDLPVTSVGVGPDGVRDTGEPAGPYRKEKIGDPKNHLSGYFSQPNPQQLPGSGGLPTAGVHGSARGFLERHGMGLSTISESDFESMPREVRDQFARTHFDLSQLGRYVFLRDDGFFSGAVPIEDPAELMSSQGLYTLALHYYPILTDPSPTLSLLTDALLSLTGEKKLMIALDPELHRRYSGQYWLGQPYVSLVDTMSRPEDASEDPNDTSTWYMWGLRPGTLEHEMGHRLMYFSYGKKFPDYEGHEGHDKKVKSPAVAATNPGAAWAEGFANGLIVGLGGDGLNPEALKADNPEWPSLPLRTRLSNEFVIEAVFHEYFTDVEYERRDGEVIGWQAKTNLERLEKVLGTLRQAGFQRDFGEFAADFLFLHPEEKERFKAILEKYHLGDLLSGPHVVERFVSRYDHMTGSIFDLAESSIRKRAWDRINEGGNPARDYLLNPNVSHEKRLGFMRRIEAYMEEALRSVKP